ncbi:ThuA domain-containing protein [Paraflavitalea pollutisoli]|uniref:ThuA domain-containing protein n=1 Tax=Paraflavitalea pollutisoli TaxID=3034143 RepID=UPI0023ED9990|nr:ThuA domain-containing protein [Paraflavitalea sp. H1-2-19X]
MNHLPARFITFISIFFASIIAVQAQQPAFRVVGFFTGKADQAHISFVKEAHEWLYRVAKENNFTYDSTSNWSNLHTGYLQQYQVVLFLDTRPEKEDQRKAFQQYMENGGAWIGFHFAAFALTPSAVPQNWDWYHNQFIGAGQYKSNTWRPTSAVVKVEDRRNPFTRRLPATFTTAPNEWYCWQNDLRENADIKILLSIDPSSFPLGTGPKPHEIWHSGYFPVAWTNKKYRMLYMNMGHNDIDYEGKTNKTLSYTFANEIESRFILNAILHLGVNRSLQTRSAE